MPSPVSKFMELVKEAGSAEAFTERFPQPFFLIEPYAEVDVSDFQTQAATRLGGRERTVSPVAKRPGANRFGSMITIGRAGNNDVVLEAEGISKFHAYVTPGQPYTLSDAGSKFGTFLGEDQLPERKSRPIQPGDQIRFGNLQVQFHSPASLYRALLELTGSG